VQWIAQYSTLGLLESYADLFTFNHTLRGNFLLPFGLQNTVEDNILIRLCI